MNQYTISDLEKLSGIRAHTIRMWEQRYNLLTPDRSDTNIRSYNDDQLRKLLNVVTLKNAGEKISKIGALSEEELNARISSIARGRELPGVQYEALINEIVTASLRFDEKGFLSAFTSGVLRYGMHGTYLNIILPALSKVGLFWGASEITPAQEHFTSCLIRQKLCAATDALPEPDTDEHWLLLLPDDEEHEIGLLFAQYLLKANGKHVIYLGQRVPTDNIELVAEIVKPSHLLYFVVRHRSIAEIALLADHIASSAPDTKVHLVGNTTLLGDMELPNTYIIRTLSEFEEAIG